MSESWKKISRRSFIKGLGGAGVFAAGSPVFNELVAQAAPPAPVRVLFVALHHGWGVGGQHGGRDGNVSDFRGTESSFTLPTTLAPFEAIKNQCVFVDGLRGTFWGNAHDVSYTDILTAGVPYGAEGGSLEYQFPRPLNASLDHALEAFQGKPALRFCANYASWGAAYHPLSIDNNRNKIPFYTRSTDAYTQIFRNAPPPGNTPVDIVTPRVLAGLSSTTAALLSRIRGAPLDRLRSYQAAFDSLSRTLTTSTGTIASGTATLDAVPTANAVVMEREIDTYLDMIRVAFTNDTHRTAVLGIGEPHQNISFTNAAGATTTIDATLVQAQHDFHHGIAHYSGTESAIQENYSLSQLGYAATRRMYCQKIVNFVQRLQNTVDFDGNSVLDNTVIVLTGEVSTGEHDCLSKMHIVIGGGSGRIQRGRWLKLPTQSTTTVRHVNTSGQTVNATIQYVNPAARDIASRSHADLLVTIANIAGLNISSFGIPVLNQGALNLG